MQNIKYSIALGHFDHLIKEMVHKGYRNYPLSTERIVFRIRLARRDVRYVDLIILLVSSSSIDIGINSVVTVLEWNPPVPDYEFVSLL